jgi:hypothetical protein
VVVLELLEALVSWLFGTFGIGGVSAGAVALLIGVLWYSREVAGVLIGLARYIKIGSAVGVAIGVALVGGVAVGAISLETGVVADLLDLAASITEAI